MRRDRQKELFIDGFRELSKGLYTCITGHVLAFDATTQLAQVQIGVKYVDEDGQHIHGAIDDCPVQFSGDGDWSVEHQITEGTEGLIVFSQRCIDAWKETGGIAQNPILRLHDKQDAVFIVGFRSKPNAIADFKNNGIRLRNKDASVYHWLKDDGTIESKNDTGIVQINNGSINITSTGNITLNGVTIDPSGNIVTPTRVTAENVTVSNEVSTSIMTASNTATVAGVNIGDKLSDYDTFRTTHTHDAGTYKDGTGASVTGESGEPNY